MSRFHNPYHFVPVAHEPADGYIAVPSKRGDTARSVQLSAGLGYRAHDRFARGAYSGRIICRLTTETPLVIGAKQVEGAGGPGSVAQFTIGDKPAIPASSLRGLISSVAEAASNSALRILETAWESREISHPSHLRSPLSKGNAVQEFAKICADLVPLGSHPGKSILTLAELVFGFVEEREKDANEDSALAFKSRLRFAHGLPTGEVKREGRVVLKELSSPKPPRATFYFQSTSSGAPISTKLPQANDRPKGRKFYLPHDKSNPASSDRADWKAKQQNPTHNRQLCAEPVAAGTDFWFHIDFDNLAPAELNLLCYALAPTADYRHRLGLGKPIGLGLCRIEPQGLYLVDRLQRYGSDQWVPELLGARRYHTGWHTPEFQAAKEFRHEVERAAKAAPGESPRQRADAFKAASPAAHHTILMALELLGHLGSLRAPIHYPTLNSAELELGLYGWFSQGPNDYLPPLPGPTSSLPVLDTQAKVPPPRPPSPAELIGSAVMASVVDLQRNGNPILSVNYKEEPIPGALQNPQKFRPLRPVPKEVRVRVLAYDPRLNRYQLELL